MTVTHASEKLPAPTPLQAADDVELTSKQQLKAILKIVSRLANSKTKPETVSRLADDKTKQLAAASAEAPAPAEEGWGSAGPPSEVDSPEGSISGEGSAAAMPPSLRSLRVGMLAVRAAAPRGADN